jgi:hypothetical protein
MKLTIAIAAFLTLFVSSAAQAEICSHHGGCFETGMKIFRNGGANVGLPYVNNRDMATNKAGYPQQGKRVRIIRETW